MAAIIDSAAEGAFRSLTSTAGRAPVLPPGWDPSAATICGDTLRGNSDGKRGGGLINGRGRTPRTCVVRPGVRAGQSRAT
jgi:hypothetical protein